MKRCGACENWKTLDEFHNDRRRADGKVPYCKRCVAKRTKRYYHDNRAAKLAKAAAYKREHREQYNELNLIAYHANIELTRLCDRIKRAINRDHYNEQQRRRSPRYRVKRATNEANRRARKRAAFVEEVDRERVHARDNGRCYLCNRKVLLDDMHLDHVIPLAKGGEHSYKNCRCACERCNLSKGDKVLA